MAEGVPAFTPVNLLTGFLGSGKTTLLRCLLADPALSGTAVLINEFAEVGLDHHLIELLGNTFRHGLAPVAELLFQHLGLILNCGVNLSS